MPHVSGRKLRFLALPLAFLLYRMASTTAFAQASTFTYQGRLTDAANPADGIYDFQFKLFDTAAVGTGTQQGTTQTLTNVAVAAGVFTVQLDFGACDSCFNGAPRFLEIEVRPAGGTFTTLAPRQPISSTPYAIKTRNLTFSGPFTNGAVTLAASNTFAGEGAGANSTFDPDPTVVVGKFNSFFGSNAGQKHISGFRNAFFGAQAGQENTFGGNNAFFGFGAGFSNTTGSTNSFFGSLAGQSNTEGESNTFLGLSAGSKNVSGSRNTFIGRSADFDTQNPMGSDNTLLGVSTLVGANISNATAIGARASVTQSNSLVLGGIAGVNSGVDTNVGIGTTAPAYKLHVIDSSNSGLRVQTNLAGGILASFGGAGDFQIDASGIPGGRFVVKESGNVGIGTTGPNDKLEVNGIIRVSALGSAGGTQLCRNGSNQIAACSSSLRYKSNISALDSGFELINQLRPVTFDWKQGSERDLGLVAEEVERVEPLLVTYNERGQVEGVKYDRITVALVNSMKELKAENDRLKQQLKQQEERLRRLEAAMSKMTGKN